MNLDLSPAVFSILSSYIEEKVGITYTTRDLELLRDKVSARAQELEFGSLLDYYYYLRYDAGGDTEFSDLVDTLVVNETYFFREWTAIQALVNSFIVPWCEAGRRPRILSAACATGEEPLSLAMLLSEKNLLNQVEIVATDISPRVLAKAQSGKFGKRSVRSVPEPSLVAKYLVPIENGYQVNPELIGAISWHQKNLLRPEQFESLGTFDAILCRNVLIYFSDQGIRNVLDTLSKSLVSDGALMVGVSESLLRYAGHFTGEERSGAFVYRKVRNH